MHHRYYAQDGGITEVLSTAFSTIREHGSACVGGAAPTPTLQCIERGFDTGIATGRSDSISVKKCLTIALHGSIGSHAGQIGGLYSKCPGEEIGGQPVFGKHQTGPYDGMCNSSKFILGNAFTLFHVVISVPLCL
jgi:hypothetical protein